MSTQNHILVISQDCQKNAGKGFFQTDSHLGKTKVRMTGLQTQTRLDLRKLKRSDCLMPTYLEMRMPTNSGRKKLKLREIQKQMSLGKTRDLDCSKLRHLGKMKLIQRETPMRKNWVRPKGLDCSMQKNLVKRTWMPRERTTPTSSGKPTDSGCWKGWNSEKH